MKKHFCDICGREIKHILFYKGRRNLDTGEDEEYMEMCTDCWREFMIEVKKHQKNMLKGDGYGGSTEGTN